MNGWLHSTLTGSVSAPSPRFLVGDVVNVLRASRLPKVEQVLHTGTIERLQEREGLPTLFWISGLPIARTAEVLRLVRRAR